MAGLSFVNTCHLCVTAESATHALCGCSFYPENNTEDRFPSIQVQDGSLDCLISPPTSLGWPNKKIYTRHSKCTNFKPHYPTGNTLARKMKILIRGSSITGNKNENKLRTYSYPSKRARSLDNSGMSCKSFRVCIRGRDTGRSLDSRRSCNSRSSRPSGRLRSKAFSCNRWPTNSHLRLLSSTDR